MRSSIGHGAVLVIGLFLAAHVINISAIGNLLLAGYGGGGYGGFGGFHHGFINATLLAELKCGQQGGTCTEVADCDISENIYVGNCGYNRSTVCCIPRTSVCAWKYGICVLNDDVSGCLSAGYFYSWFVCNSTHRCCLPTKHNPGYGHGGGGGYGHGGGGYGQQVVVGYGGGGGGHNTAGYGGGLSSLGQHGGGYGGGGHGGGGFQGSILGLLGKKRKK